MSYTLITVPQSRQSIKQLPPDVRRQLVDALRVLETDPTVGEQLSGEFRRFRSFHWKYRNTEYRVIYEIDDKRQEVIIRYAASRENFYRNLRHAKLRPLVFSRA